MEDLTIYIEYLDPDEERPAPDLVDPLEEMYESTVQHHRRTAYTVSLATEADVRQVLNLASSLTPEGQGEDSEPIYAYGPVGLQGRGFDHVYPLTIAGQALVLELMEKLACETTRAE